jgi:8-oxo-dGTP diphosphatase
MWSGQSFSGSKIALILDDAIVAYKRDEKPDIPFPGMWDLPGGGREGIESPVDCAIREVHEEFGVELLPSHIRWEKGYAGRNLDSLPTYFLVAPITPEHLKTVVFGSEGQCWRVMPIIEFLGHPTVISFLENAAPRLPICGAMIAWLQPSGATADAHLACCSEATFLRRNFDRKKPPRKDCITREQSPSKVHHGMVSIYRDVPA